jgi:ribose-phosphate pyrophosphokinase
MQINKYPDNSSYVVAHPQEEITYRVNSYEDLWHLNQVVDALNNLDITPTITLPNLIDAQADRRFNSNESSGLKLVCKFLNSMKANFKIFHPHNPEVVEALIDNVKIIDNYGYIGRILSEYFNNGKGIKGSYQDNITLFSSDAGGFKPLMKLADKLNWIGEVYGASKSRKYEDGKSKLIQVIDKTDFKGKDILIIDDICVYGGTFKGLSKMLKERNCGKLYLAISHMTIDNLGADPVTNYFDKIFTTNSKGFEYLVEGTGHDKIGYRPSNLEIIEIFN